MDTAAKRILLYLEKLGLNNNQIYALANLTDEEFTKLKNQHYYFNDIKIYNKLLQAYCKAKLEKDIDRLN